MKKRTHQEAILESFARVIGCEVSRWDPEARVQTRGIGLEAYSPGDGKTRYAIAVYDGTGTGIMCERFRSLGIGELRAQLSAITDAEDIRQRLSDAK